MIVYINHEPIKFSGVERTIRILWLRRRFFSSLGKVAGGPRVVAENLLKELDMRRDIYWDLSFREIPRNKTISIIWVVNNVDDLRWAIVNKKKVGAKELWAGPNLVIVPQESGSILNSHEIDQVIVPCEWVKKFYEIESSDLMGKTRVWPAGIDTQSWSPLDIKNTCSGNILVYNKNQNSLCAELLPILEKYGKVNVVRYGEYSLEGYKQALNDAVFMVWLSQSESHGLALLEALSMNVPVLAWNPGKWSYQSRELRKQFRYDNASSCPYFSPQCGLKFKSGKDFDNRLIEFMCKVKKSEFRPRDYLFKANLIIGKTIWI